jgi:hypothetical protein
LFVVVFVKLIFVLSPLDMCCSNPEAKLLIECYAYNDFVRNKFVGSAEVNTKTNTTQTKHKNTKQTQSAKAQKHKHKSTNQRKKESLI